MNIFVLRSHTNDTQAILLANSLGNPISIYNYVKDVIKYKEDSIWEGWRTPDETITDKLGDCVDKSLLSKSMLDTLCVTNRLVMKYKYGKRPEAHIYNQVLIRGYWTDFDTSCTTCTIGRSFAHDWTTIAIIFNEDTVIFNPQMYYNLME